MKRYLLIIIVTFGCISLTMAQKENGREKIQALKVAFISQKLHLTPSEAEKFWPVYNQYDGEIRQLRSTKKNGDVLDNEQKVLDIRKKYKPSFEKILGSARLNDLYNAERDFRNVLIQRLKERR
ncbi:MAG: hypothetical protein ABI136_04890 [Ginsengibacter sp.]